ncbi:hypothetical protein [Nostoc sp.]|uniref:hypothetical protein n=1 Tax=Nostoc sp. TaxID=1180 RepID=UPI002FF917D0
MEKLKVIKNLYAWFVISTISILSFYPLKTYADTSIRTTTTAIGAFNIPGFSYMILLTISYIYTLFIMAKTPIPNWNWIKSRQEYLILTVAILFIPIGVVSLEGNGTKFRDYFLLTIGLGLFNLCFYLYFSLTLEERKARIIISTIYSILIFISFMLTAYIAGQ